MRTAYVDDTWGTVAARTDLDGTKSVTLEFDRQEDHEDHERIEFVMNPKLAKQVARQINAAVRTLS